MTINDINTRVIAEFSRISTSNAPSVDDGGGNFLTTVASVLNYWTPYDKVTAHPCLMVVPFKRSYAPMFSGVDAIGITLTFDIHGVVSSTTGTTGGKNNASILCENLINDCIRTARVLWKSDISASTRFKIAKVQAIDTQPIRLDENRYCFFFQLAVSTFPLEVI